MDEFTKLTGYNRYPTLGKIVKRVQRLLLDTPVKEVVQNMENETRIKLDAGDHSVLATLEKSVSGMSAEDLGSNLALDKMLLLYQLDKLVKQGLLKRSRPMFMQPELYEVTERGRENLSV